MAQDICSKCGKELTWREVDYNLRIERRRDPKTHICAICGKRDFEQKLAIVKQRQQQRASTRY